MEHGVGLADVLLAVALPVTRLESRPVPPPYHAALPRALPGTKPAISSSTYESPVMDVIAWIVLGLGAGVLANMAIPGRSRQRSRSWAHR
jgi:hypothetical protein